MHAEKQMEIETNNQWLSKSIKWQTIFQILSIQIDNTRGK